MVGLSQPGDISDNGSLKKHLSDSQTIDLLARALSPYSTPTAQTKSSFETKTSAINIPPSFNGRYDIKELKDDSLWLSDRMKIDEIAALRIVVLEWQKRPANRMLLDSPYDEKIQFGPSIRENGLKTSISSPRHAAPRNQVGLEKSNNCSFDSSHARRQRLVHIYLSERRYILKTSEHIAFSALFEASLNASYNSGERVIRQALSMSGWIEEIGNEILAFWNLNGVTHENGKNIIQNCVDALQSRIENLEMAKGWLQDEDIGESIELAWGENQVLEMIHIMQIMLTLLNSSKQITRTDALLTWFRFIGKYCFFETFVLVGLK